MDTFLWIIAICFISYIVWNFLKECKEEIKEELREEIEEDLKTKT